MALVKKIVCGSPTTPETGMQWQLAEVRKEAGAAKRVLWLIATACIGVFIVAVLNLIGIAG